MTKSEQIKQTRLATREKRQVQVCKTFEVKIDESHLNRQQREAITMIFVEAKWCWNHILSQGDLPNFDYKTLIKVQTLDKNKNPIQHEIKHLSAKNRQDVLYKMRDAVKSLGAIKKKAHRKVGELKFKSHCNTIEMSQYGVTHKINGAKTIKLNGIKKPIRVNGLEQITPSMELANAKFCKRASGYYLVFTTYQTKTIVSLPTEDGGADLGVKNNVTDSSGKTYNVSIPESEHLRKLQQDFSRTQKGSKNRNKVRVQIQKCHEHIANQRKDKANKIVHELLTKYKTIYFQDENLRAWHAGWFGKQVQYSCMGTVKRKLREQPERTKMLCKAAPTTKLCLECNAVMNPMAKARGL